MRSRDHDSLPRDIWQYPTMWLWSASRTMTPANPLRPPSRKSSQRWSFSGRTPSARHVSLISAETSSMLDGSICLLISSERTAVRVPFGHGKAENASWARKRDSCSSRGVVPESRVRTDPFERL